MGTGGAFAEITYTATTTSLAATSGGASVSSTSSGTIITFTATVSAGTSHPANGLVTFCDAPTASACTFLHVLGTAQLRGGANAGTAIFRYTPGIGSHNFFALLGVTNFGPSAAYAASASAAVPVTIISEDDTTTLISQSGSAGNYTLTATVVSSLGSFPSGDVSFLDESNSYGLLASAPLVAGSSTANFSVASHPYITGGPQAMVTADFDGDGILDLAIANAFNDTVTVLRGSGAGAFEVVSSFTVGDSPTGIATGDFNGDGIPDLAVANQYDGTVTVLLGNGDGTFNSSTVSIGGEPANLVVGDFNGDGIADLEVGGYGSVNILLGNGNGTFTSGPTINNVDGPEIIMGDFNGDGITDIAVSGTYFASSTFIYLGHGDGTFAQGATLPCGGPLATGDFNGDGIADIAVAGYPSACIFRGNGNGTFTTPDELAIAIEGAFMAVADFNGDGVADLLINGGIAAQLDGIMLLQGKGDGTFSIGAPIPVNTNENYSPGGLTVGDFNSDGHPDFVAIAYGVLDGISPASLYNDYGTVFLTSAAGTATATVTGINPTGTGTHNVAAFYSGQGDYTPSVSATTPLTTTSLLPNSISFPQPASPVAVGSTTMLGATSTSGSVTYIITAGTATLSGANITFTTGGTVQITAYSAATSTYAAATPVSVLVTVSFAQAFFSWQPSALSIYTGTPLGTSVLDATYSVPGSIGYTSALQPSGAAIAALSSTILSAGNYTLAATATPTSSGYAVTSDSLPFTVQNMNVFLANSAGSVSSLFNIGTVQSSATTGGGIGEAVDSNGFVWSISADGNSIQKFTDYGVIAASYNSAGISGAKALALDGTGNVWAANGNGNITVLANTGAALFTIAGSTTTAASSVAIDNSGNAWLSNPTTNSIDEIIGGAAPAAPLAIAAQMATPATKP